MIRQPLPVSAASSPVPVLGYVDLRPTPGFEMTEQARAAARKLARRNRKAT